MDARVLTRQNRDFFVKSRARNSGPTTLIALKIELVRHIKAINIMSKYD